MGRRLALAALAGAMAAGAVLVPAASASAAGFYFEYDPADTVDGTREGGHLYGYPSGSNSSTAVYAGDVEFWSAAGGEVVRHLQVCDNKSDGQPVYALIKVPDGRVLSYKAPAHAEPGQGNDWPSSGCWSSRIYYPVTSYALKVGNSTSSFIAPPPRQ
ncbi:hypothetical protein [Kineosporia babensis]|uniref:Secreted protein n=1 Tax=Kineosporia babensis TaxID=499548 RepID=A0A9X1NJC4_9ACTN|nr:hypothetical protein [Kineosporia babensis]MCD5314776.1 hypothetical protein [Kineosporia babensis]